MQEVQNKAAHIMTGTTKLVPINTLLTETRWGTLDGKSMRLHF